MRPPTAKWPKKSDQKNWDKPEPRSSTRIMSREAALSVAEREFIFEALRQDTRLDGRQPDQFRPLNVSFGEEYGHVKLQLGKTRFDILALLLGIWPY